MITCLPFENLLFVILVVLVLAILVVQGHQTAVGYMQMLQQASLICVVTAAIFARTTLRFTMLAWWGTSFGRVMSLLWTILHPAGKCVKMTISSRQLMPFVKPSSPLALLYPLACIMHVQPNFWSDLQKRSTEIFFVLVWRGFFFCLYFLAM